MSARMSYLRPGLLGFVLLGIGACDDGQHPGGTGSISIEVTAIDGQPLAAPANEAGQVSVFDALAQDSAKVTVTGPTTKTVLLTKSTTFTGTVTDLPVGAYAVNAYTYLGAVVSYYGTASSVTVSANQTATATISNFATFQPSISGTITSPTDAFRVNVPFTSVGTNATAYKVETASNPGFTTSLTSVQVTGSPGTATASATGTWYVRVSAINATGAPTGGLPSSTGTFSVVTDRRASADDPASAPNLGFFATTTTTLDSLNIFPAGDADWFSLTQCNGDSLTLSALALRLTPSSPLNSVLQVYNTAGLLLAQNDDSGGTNTDAFVRVAHTADGAYKVRVVGSGTSVGHYRVSLQGKPGNNNLTPAPSCRTTPLTANVVSSGVDHSCSIRSTNIVDCWGQNVYGQLGNGTNVSSASATRITGATTFQQVSAGGFHTCAVTTPPGSPGAAYCWGNNAFGQLGDASTTSRNTPTAVTGGLTFTTVSAGDAHSCGLTAAGTAYCWGRNGTGQLGDNSTTARTAPALVSGLLTFQSISAGSAHTCGLTTGNLTYCWGSNSDGQIGDGSVTQRNVPTLVIGGVTFTSVRAGGFHSCGVTGPGAAHCWGRNDFGEIGDGTFTDRTNPATVSGGLIFSSVTPGRNSTCGIAFTVSYCWGSNFQGQVGDNSIVDRSGPVQVAGGLTFQSLAPGGFHTCGVQAGTLTIYCWGWNQFGQLGDAQPFNHAGPGLVTGAPAFKSISSGSLHTCAVATATSFAYCWGWNYHGQLGDGSFTDRSTAQTISGALTFQTIAAGLNHTCALTTGNQVYCWGNNTYGQFGNGGTAASANPVIGAGGQSFTQISVGDDHTCGRNSAAQVLCWGYGGDGQLGNGGTGNNPIPVSVSGASYASVAAGPSHTCAVTSTGTAFCWGDNSTGGLGDGTTTQRLTPQLVTGSNVFATLSAGFGFTCARTAGNTALCWGAGGAGQLGNNATNNTSQAVTVAGGLTWNSVTTNRNQTACGTTTTSILLCWGSNFVGQIGDGTFTDRSAPTATVTGQAFTTVASGDSHTCALTAGGTSYCWGHNERGELGTGTRTIKTVPGPVAFGPASAPPVFAGSSLFDPLAGDRRSPDPGRGGRDGRAAAKPDRTNSR